VRYIQQLMTTVLTTPHITMSIQISEWEGRHNIHNASVTYVTMSVYCIGHDIHAIERRLEFGNVAM